MSKKIKRQINSGVVQNHAETMFHADGIQAKRITWALLAKSTDLARAILCNRFWLCLDPKNNKNAWIMATDGRRLHGIKLSSDSLRDQLTVGTYRVIRSGVEVDAILEKDNNYPNAWGVVPEITLCDDTPVFIPDSRAANKSPCILFEVFSKSFKATGSFLSVDYTQQAISGFTGLSVYVSQKDALNPLMLLDSGIFENCNTFAVIMPVRR